MGVMFEVGTCMLAVAGIMLGVVIGAWYTLVAIWWWYQMAECCVAHTPRFRLAWAILWPLRMLWNLMWLLVYLVRRL